MNKEKLVSFLYILMRDELPSGKIIGIIKDHCEPDFPCDGWVYTAKHLEAYAREIADRLLGESMSIENKMEYVEEFIIPALAEAMARGDKKYPGIRHWNSDVHTQRGDEDDIRHVRTCHADVRLLEAEDAASTGDIALAQKKIVSAIGYLCILHARVSLRDAARKDARVE